MANHPRRAFLGAMALIAGSGALALALTDEKLLEDEGPVPAGTQSRFRAVYANPAERARFRSFLRHVFHVLPDATLDAVIAEGCRRYDDDAEIYRYLQRRLPEVTPTLSTLRYALPALRLQRAEMVRETARLVRERGRIERYVEIGTPGRYVHALRDALVLGDEVYLVNETEPSFGPVDIAEREQLSRAGAFVALENYAPITRHTIPKGRVDLITNYIGLHHAPRDRFDEFVASIHEALRPSGTFVLRDHDVASHADDTLVALAHDVFNAGTGASLDRNERELRFFLSIEETEARLLRHGFRRIGPRLAQPGDPTRNLLVAFERT